MQILQELLQNRLSKESQLFRDLECPSPTTLRLHVNLDIESALDFDQSNDAGLFVSYFVDLPAAWHSDSKLAGRTQRSRPYRGQVNFSHCAEIVLDLNDCIDWELAGWPRLLISVASMDSWTRYTNFTSFFH